MADPIRDAIDNSPDGARSLGKLSRRSKIARGSLSSIGPFVDIVDYYKFRVSGSGGTARITLNNLQENADIVLLDKDQNVISSSLRPGIRRERIKAELEKGVYFIQVSQVGSNTNYTLSAKARLLPTIDPEPEPEPEPPPPPPGPGTGTGTLPPGPAPIIPPSDPGNTPGTAFLTGSIGDAKTYRENVSAGSDPFDVYRFRVDQSSRVTITTGNATGEGVRTSLIFDINGNGVVDPGDVITSGDGMTRSLSPGNYFVQVDSLTTSNVSYDLRLEATPISGISPATNPFFGLRQATDLGVLTSASSTLKQVVGSINSADIYKFTLTNQVSDLTLLLNTSQPTGDVTVSLLYDSGNDGIPDPGADFIAGAFTSGAAGANAATLTLNRTLGDGTYYLVVTSKELVDNTTYDLNLFVNNAAATFVNSSYDQSIIGPDVPADITPAANPGNSVNAATEVTGLSVGSPVYVKQFVGASDPSDFYKFTLPTKPDGSPYTVIITYGGTPRATSLRLGVDRNNNGILDRPEDLNNDGILNNEDLNNDGILDPEEDKNNNTIIDSEDIDGDGILDPNEVFEPFPSVGLPEGRAVYSPLPPYFDATAAFDLLPNAFVTPVPTAIYANLQGGTTYYLEVQANLLEVDLGDSLRRFGPDNILYDLKFLIDG